MSDHSENKGQLPKFYTPKEVAEIFGITPNALKHRRLRGQIEGVVINENTVVYTEEQVRKANLAPMKRGPKPKKEKAKQNEGTTNAA
jgi:hypothetical protein